MLIASLTSSGCRILTREDISSYSSTVPALQLGEARFSNEGGVTADAGVTVEKGSCRVDYEIEGNIWKADVIAVNGGAIASIPFIVACPPPQK